MPSCRRFGSKNAYPECLSRMPIQNAYPNFKKSIRI